MHSSAVVQDLTPSYYNKTIVCVCVCVLESNGDIFSPKNSGCRVDFDTTVFQLNFLWLEVHCQYIKVCSICVV